MNNYTKDELNFNQKIRHIFGWCFYKIGYHLWAFGYKITLKINEEVSVNKINRNKND